MGYFIIGYGYQADLEESEITKLLKQIHKMKHQRLHMRLQKNTMKVM